MTKRIGFAMVGVFAMSAAACTSLPVTPRAELSDVDGGGKGGGAGADYGLGASIDGNASPGIDGSHQGGVVDVSLPDSPAMPADSLSGGPDGGAADMVDAIDSGSLGTGGSGGTGGMTSSTGGTGGGGVRGTGGIATGGASGQAVVDAGVEAPGAPSDAPLSGVDAADSLAVDSAVVDSCVESVGEGCGSCGGKITCEGACSITTPSDYGTGCGSCGGAITCAGTCSIATPSNYGHSCGCGGTITCNSTCSSAISPTTWYQDVDGDGYGNASVPQSACSKPSGYVSNSTDCCDTDANAHPGQTSWFTAVNACGSWDWNCDGVITKEVPDTNSGPPVPSCTGLDNSGCDQTIPSGDSSFGGPVTCGNAVVIGSYYCVWTDSMCFLKTGVQAGTQGCR
jgi:hypothetical protein